MKFPEDYANFSWRNSINWSTVCLFVHFSEHSIWTKKTFSNEQKSVHVPPVCNIMKSYIFICFVYPTIPTRIVKISCRFLVMHFGANTGEVFFNTSLVLVDDQIDRINNSIVF